MRRLRFLDHLTPWMSWGALLTSGVFTGPELLVMAVPLLLALAIEVMDRDLGRFEMWAQWGALACLLPLLALGTGVVPGVAQLLFILCGLRLALPRDLGRRRQILLMAFLLFLLAATASLDLAMGLWMLAWLGGASVVLLQQAWEPSAQLKRHMPPRPPFRVLGAYGLVTLLLGGALFAVLPRISVGLKPPAWARLGWGSRAGLSDHLELGGSGPIRSDSDVVMRLEPLGPSTEEREALASSCSLLRALSLEVNQDGAWSPWRDRQAREVHGASRPGLPFRAFYTPDPLSLVPLPYNLAAPPRSEGVPLVPGPGGAQKWAFPTQRVTSLSLSVIPRMPLGLREPLEESERPMLTRVEGPVELLRAWVKETVPEPAGPLETARRLEARLHTFRYTLDNPSGRSEDPLADFLTRTQAGHCEYFASALALMLRTQGIPARVVNGYRLGPWIEAGGYFAVTRGDAHAWVECYDEARKVWVALDPTPAAPPGLLEGHGLLASLNRGLDALSFRWDRYVVRFSDQDQVSLMTWTQERMQGSLPSLARLLPAPALRTRLVIGASVLFLALLAWRLHLSGHLRFTRRPLGHLPQLAPLLRATRKGAEPHPGETPRAWLTRLSTLRPERAPALSQLADLADRVAYGKQGDRELRNRVEEEVNIWKKQKDKR